MKTNNPVLLIVLDGWGVGKPYSGNAISQAKTPIYNQLNKKYPHCLLKASGHAVGVPRGVMGASEPGHITLGAGRIVWQPFEEINQAIKDKSFFKKKSYLKACQNVTKNNSRLHLIGLLSDGGIHSHEKHLFALLELAKKQQIKDVYIHIFADGRDVHEQSIGIYLKRLHKQIKKHGRGKIASIIGRFYAMDRDNNWKRTKVAYDLLTKGEGSEVTSFSKAIKAFYNTAEENEDTDYYLKALISKKDFAPIKNKDSVICFNYRSDRARQITTTFTDKYFKEFKTDVFPTYICTGPYSDIAPITFPPAIVPHNLGETLSKAGLKQLRIAETEKYAHVTFFFNSQVKKAYLGEKRILIKSPKVASYAEKPEMSASELTKKVCQEISQEKHDFILLNYANPDLVGHSGNIKATIKAIETVDISLGKTVSTALQHGYQLIITADHGNAEEMIYYGTNIISPAHSTNPVNCILISPHYHKFKPLSNKGLSNIAPTILKMLKLKKPRQMTGKSLI